MKYLPLNVCVSLIVICGILPAKSQVNIEASSEITSLVTGHISSNKVIDGKQKGYRVQIFFDSGNNSKQQAINVQNEFASRYPKVSSYVLFKEPNFRVRVGDFRTRTEARGFQQRIIEQYLLSQT
jgi:hypothetical protein